jgi:TonB family protein
LLRYTFAFSLVAHFGVWGVLAARHIARGQAEAETGARRLTVNVVRTSYEKLPQAPSIESSPVVERAPRGAAAVGAVGEVPLPVPDVLADANTIADPDANVGPGTGPGTTIIVDDPGNPNPNIDPALFPDFSVEYSEPPVCTREAKPVYPEIARASGVEGDVILLVYIDPAGRVRNAVVQSSPGLPALEEEATKAAYECEFSPARQQGQPVGVWYSLVMQFRL